MNELDMKYWRGKSRNINIRRPIEPVEIRTCKKCNCTSKRNTFGVFVCGCGVGGSNYGFKNNEVVKK